MNDRFIAIAAMTFAAFLVVTVLYVGYLALLMAGPVVTP
jgi:hypothetical protein